MATVTYTAKSSLAPGHIAGEVYSIVFTLDDYDQEIEQVGESFTSMAGNRETVTYRRDRKWRVTTGYLADVNADYMAEFLDSVSDGSTFTFDRDATSLDSNGEPVAVRPMLCDLDSPGVKFRRVDPYSRRYFRFQFTMRELGQPTFSENYFWELDLTRGVVPDGWTYTRTGTMYAMDSDGIFKPYAADVMPAHYDAVAGRWLGAWFGISTTNSLLYSSDISNAAWATNSAAKSAAAGSVIQGGTAQKITSTATSGAVYQALGTFGANPDTVFAIVEKGDSDKASVSIYDVTAATTRLLAELTFSTGAVTRSGSDASGNVRAQKLLNTGPNGGEVWLIALTASVGALTNGNTRRVYVYPSDRSSSTQFGYVHHVQLHANHTAGVQSERICPPIVTTTVAATRGHDTLSCSTVPTWWTQRDFTMGVEFTQPEATNFPNAWLLTVSDGTASNYAAIDITSNSPRARCTVAASTVASMILTAGAGYRRIAMRVKANDFAAISNTNATTLTDTAGPLFSTASKWNVGSAYSNSSQPTCYIGRALFAPESYTNEELKAWTG